MMTENPGSPSDEESEDRHDEDACPLILPPEDPESTDGEPWSHARHGDDVEVGQDDRPPSTAAALALIGGGVLALVIAIAVVVSLLSREPVAPRPSPAPRAAPATKPPAPFPTTAPSPPRTNPPHSAERLPDFSGEPSPRQGRITDHRAGLSYARLGRPWRDGVAFASTGFSAGQHYVTEHYPGGTWEATIMSGRRPARTPAYEGPNRWFRAAVAQETELAQRYYPADHRRAEVASQPVRVSGHDGWLLAARLRFHKRGLRARSELMVVVAIDTGHPTPGLLYISIPDTEKDRLPDIGVLVKSLRVVS